MSRTCCCRRPPPGAARSRSGWPSAPAAGASSASCSPRACCSRPIGGAAGVLLAWMVVRAFEAAPPPAGALPIALEFAVDRRVLLFSLVLSVATGLVFGAAPALQASRPGLVPALKDEAFVPDGRSRRFNLKKVLVVGRSRAVAAAPHRRRAVHSQPPRHPGDRSGIRGGPARHRAAQRQHPALHQGPGARVLPRGRPSGWNRSRACSRPASRGWPC